MARRRRRPPAESASRGQPGRRPWPAGPTAAQPRPRRPSPAAAAPAACPSAPPPERKLSTPAHAMHRGCGMLIRGVGGAHRLRRPDVDRAAHRLQGKGRSPASDGDTNTERQVTMRRSVSPAPARRGAPSCSARAAPARPPAPPPPPPEGGRGSGKIEERQWQGAVARGSGNETTSAGRTDIGSSSSP